LHLSARKRSFAQMMQMRTLSIFFICVISAGVMAAQEPTTISLSQAIAIALEKSPARKMALAGVNEAKANVELGRSAFLPHVDLAETLTRGNDPVYAFGTRLRQGRFAETDFALDRLNYPDLISNFSSRLGAEWNVFESFGSRFRLRGARSMQRSAEQQLSRADQSLLFQVITSYYGLLLARKQLDLATQTMKTAQAVSDSASSKVEAGTTVEADALAAKVMLATRQQELIRARGALEVAQAQLETALGARLAPGQQPVDVLKEHEYPATELEKAEAQALEQRPDLQALISQQDAQRSSVKAAKSALGPRLNLFGSVQADNPSLAHGGSSNWMTGVELRIDLLARDKNAKLAVENAALQRSDAARQMATDNIRLEVHRAYSDFASAQQMLEVTRGSVTQAEETLRVIRDRYDSGLVPVTELLRAEDAAKNSQTTYWQSVYAKSISYAALQLATGDLTSQSPAVTQ
jgi:outer membrane protein